ncbi:hypothetical protein B0H19DRAFT_1208894 [Mycena capillaripes]|nr:hypothetical protein B0H19DRAFT_1208894 [Mycena capillaripes]
MRDYIAAQFGTVSPAAVHMVSERVAAGDFVTANSAEERRVLRLMKEVNLINSSVPGSAQSKLGLPSFYITINPANVYNPLVKFLAGSGIDPDTFLPKDVPDYVQQAVTIAKNPPVAARFFNVYMKVFIKCILGYYSKKDDEEVNAGVLGV